MGEIAFISRLYHVRISLLSGLDFLWESVKFPAFKVAQIGSVRPIGLTKVVGEPGSTPPRNDEQYDAQERSDGANALASAPLALMVAARSANLRGGRG